MEYSFVGKVNKIRLVDNVLVLDWLSFPPSEEAGGSEPAEQFVISPESFMKMVNNMQRFAERLEQQGIIVLEGNGDG